MLVSFYVTRHFLVFLCEGNWHQYDDIICAHPTRMQQVKKTLKEIFGPEQKQSLKKGRQIAGNVMLETIFELLRSWTDVNLKNFRAQLNQFFEVYSEPYVYEEKVQRWLSLDYGKNDVSSANLDELLAPVERHRKSNKFFLFPGEKFAEGLHGSQDGLSAAGWRRCVRFGPAQIRCDRAVCVSVVPAPPERLRKLSPLRRALSAPKEEGRFPKVLGRLFTRGSFSQSVCFSFFFFFSEIPQYSTHQILQIVSCCVSQLSELTLF